MLLRDAGHRKRNEGTYAVIGHRVYLCHVVPCADGITKRNAEWTASVGERVLLGRPAWWLVRAYGVGPGATGVMWGRYGTGSGRGSEEVTQGSDNDCGHRWLR
jgi:hypothetical protein